MNEILTSLKQELKNLEIQGKTGTPEWWSVAERIDEIELDL
jgi:hypothetical protein